MRFQFFASAAENFNWHLTLTRLFSSRSHYSSRNSISAESFYTSLLEKCTHIIHLRQIHSQLYTNGLQNNGFIITKLIHVSSNLKEIHYARQLFDEFPDQYVFLWNAIIRGYSMHNMFDSVVEMYSRMQQAFVSPDTFTFPHVLKACGSLLAKHYGRAVHAQIFRLGLEEDVFVQNGLLSFYVKCDDNNLARVIFYGLSNRDVVSWTLIISGYAQNGQYMEALSIFKDMRRSDVKPDCIALVSVLKAYSDVEELNQGRCLHSLVIKMGHEFEPDLRIALTSLYAKCGQVSAAKSLFDQMKVEDVILWNAMISGFAKNGHANEAMELFTEMITKSIQPDAVTIQASALASAQLGSLDQARWMDNYVKNSKFGGDVIVSTALIDMYVKCGSVELARDVFNRTVDKDVVVWSAMLMGYGLHGWGREAISLFNEMKDAGIHPNDVTFLALITACSHCGLVEEGWEYFLSMKDYGIEPNQKHYAGVVDLLGRAGYLEKAYNFIMTMPVEPGVSVWGALLSACKIHRRVTLGEYAAEKLFNLDPLNTGHYVVLSNLYASARMWDGVAKVRVVMKSKGLNKDLGYSMIEIDGKLQAFRIGDKSHPRSDEIYKKLEWLEMRLLESGFVPDTESALHDLDKEDKEVTLCNHSERLAIAYGLISTCPGTTLRITKNLRACVNCHLATKLISKFVNREIVVRDANRFHHFKDGTCSCGDYW
ncbi:UNVERIFIED_CONTAM: Pentatricopeptide repeat-containing protein [Sesamum radiatum]|uniref:Pentatricopeptide repeat-containing protein n=1 Tax=Sesamum radiatum TaxID=300843 RepID=A0AAW2T568_SESRA